MGFEATCQCRLDNLSANAKVLLEARDLILHAPLRRTVKLAEVSDVDEIGDRLRFRAGSLVIVLELAAGRTATWARKITTPPPRLAQKLGIGHASTAFVIGTIDEPALVEALDGHVADPTLAALSLATVRDDQDLGHALTLHESAMGKAPIWIVHGKGRSAPFGEAPVRKHMRERGYRDTKVSAVSTALSATRYSSG